MALRRGDGGAGVFDLQRRRQELGYGPGPIDGIVGPRSRAATRPKRRPVRQAAGGGGEPRWMVIARPEICAREARAGQPSNARVVECHRSTSRRERDILLLGGNRGNHVNIKAYSKSRLPACRWPATSPSTSARS